MSVQTVGGAVGRPNRADPSRITGSSGSAARIPSRNRNNGTARPIALPGPSAPGLVIARYRNEQAAISDQVVRVIRQLWDQHIDPDHFSASWRELAPVVKEVIAQHYQASAASASQYYIALHAAHGLGVAQVPGVTVNQSYLTNMSGAVANGTFYHQLNKEKLLAADASVIARNTYSGAGAKFALLGGRDSVIGAIPYDKSATGWERLTSDDPCTYCMMYAARGPYTHGSPGFNDFHTHDYCHCVAAPLFHGHKSVNVEMKDTWSKVTKGKTGTAARAAWEDYWKEQDVNAGNSSNDSTAQATAGQGAGDAPVEQ